MTVRRSLRRIHLWLGWAIGVPLLFWTASGLWMAARPIDEVRGTALRVDPAPLALPPTLTPPRLHGAIATLTIEMQEGRPRWIVGLANGDIARADAGTGAVLPAVDEAEARRLARAAYRPAAPIVSARRTPADAPPLDLRRPRPAWQIAFADGAHVYVDAQGGTILAIRSTQWRWYDWMWGLHIMDLQGRETTSHAILIAVAALALLASLIAVVLLPLAVKRKRR